MKSILAGQPWYKKYRRAFMIGWLLEYSGEDAVHEYYKSKGADK